MTRRVRSLARLLAVVLAAGCLATSAWAQTGGLKIKVFEQLEDGSQETLPGATVQLSEANGRLEPLVQVTDVEGEALFPLVPVDGEQGGVRVRGLVSPLGVH